MSFKVTIKITVYNTKSITSPFWWCCWHCLTSGLQCLLLQNDVISRDALFDGVTFSKLLPTQDSTLLDVEGVCYKDKKKCIKKSHKENR